MDNEDKIREALIDIKQNSIYYWIVGIVSFLSLAFLPMLGTTVGLAWNVPDTTVGWIVWCTVRLAIAVINILLFDCFRKQAKLNIKDDEHYKEACSILMKSQKKAVVRSPGKYLGSTWAKKGTTIFLSSLLATVALTQALLTYDWLSMLTYLFTIIMGVIFGIIQMKNDEIYWTEEFYQYAKNIEKERKEQTQDDKN